MNDSEMIDRQLMQTIKDSGDRTEYESGAVRDMKEGKGRCDLMPLDILSGFYKDTTILDLYEYQQTGDVECLFSVLDSCVRYELRYGRSMFPDEATMFLEVAKHFEEGAKKYGECNWQKGIPEWSYIDSAVRHYLKWLRGDTDERHDRAFVWNIMCLIWTHYHITNESNSD